MFRLVSIGPKLVELVVLVDGFVQQVLTVRQLRCMVLWLSVVLVLQLQQRVQLVSLLAQEPTAATPPTPQPALLRRLRSVVISWWADCHPDECSFQPVLTVAAKCLQPDRIVHGLEQQPCGVQVVERVRLVVFRGLSVFQNFQGDVFYHAFYLGFVLQHMRRSEMSFKVG
jgi:hypothetical protein